MKLIVKSFLDFVVVFKFEYSKLPVIRTSTGDRNLVRITEYSNNWKSAGQDHNKGNENSEYGWNMSLITLIYKI